MSLIPGSRLGPYEVLSRLGAGGMGEVYCAKDTKLGRQVAIKVLPDAVAQDPQRLARFEREAKVLASLNHPNIAQIYGIEHQALVMELVEGQTLKGPLPLETALDYAKQIALALEAAHDKGITHRDLKPANVMITPAGVVKVLDFGLAAVSHDETSAPVDAENSPTLSHATQAGVIMGTAAYMSPEQASGKPVDKRSDIWSFGVVLYEMLTGKRLFEGETFSHTLAAILAKEPELGRLSAGIRPLVERCLRQDPRKRWRDIGDVRMALDEPAAEPPSRRNGVRIWQTIAAVLLLGVVAALWAPWQGPPTSARPFMMLDVDVGPDSVSQPAISPDGLVVVFVSRNRLVMRRLDQTAITVLAGTEGASFPFFSPNGQSVAFFADRKIKRVDIQGGAPTPICDTLANRGGSWGEDGFIIAPMENLGGLFRIPVAGGAPQPLTSTKDDPERMGSHRWPQILPGGKGVLFAATTGTRGSLRVLEAGGNVKTLVRNSSYGRYLPSGHLIYYQSGTLFAAPMSLDSLILTGPAVALDERVAYTANIANADFDVAPSGTLVYVRGAPETGQVVSWLDSAGKVTPILAKAGEYSYLRLSPDGKRLAFVRSQEGKVDLWVYDLALEALSQITSDGATKGYPVWTPDSAFIVFISGEALSWARADGSGRVERLEAAMVRPFPWSISRAGDRLAFADTIGIRTVSVEQTPTGLRLGQPKPPFQNGYAPAISSDGRFLAYSTQLVGSEVYVMFFPGPDGTGNEPKTGRWPISNDGGAWPIWPRGGREIFYTGADRRIRAAAYTIRGDSFISEKPRIWSPKVLADVGSNPNFDMDSTGHRAVVLIDPSGGESKPETHLRILLNLDEELARRTAALRKP